MDLIEFGETVRRWRIANGLSQRRLGSRIDMSQATISRLERGLLPGIRLYMILDLLALMGFGRPQRSPSTA